MTQEQTSIRGQVEAIISCDEFGKPYPSDRGSTVKTGLLSSGRAVMSPTPYPSTNDPASASPMSLISTNRVNRLITQSVWVMYDELTANDQPNDAITRSGLKETIEKLLVVYLQKGVILRFEVIVDDRNNPPSVLETGVPAIDVVWESVSGTFHQTSIRPNGT